jgi:hypothetical protein
MAETPSSTIETRHPIREITLLVEVGDDLYTVSTLPPHLYCLSPHFALEQLRWEHNLNEPHRVVGHLG